MLRHVVMFSFSDDATGTQKGALRAALEAMPGIIPEIERFSVGSDAGIAEGNHDMVVVADFADVEAFRAYRDHPDHQQLIAEHVRPIVAARAAVQYEV